MTEIEKDFFETFNIKPKWKDYRSQNTTIYTEEQAKEIRKTNRNIQLVYPQITSDILLGLICILNDFEGIDVKATTTEELKEELLKQCIEPFEYPIAFEEHHEINKLYKKIQSLFTEA